MGLVSGSGEGQKTGSDVPSSSGAAWPQRPGRVLVRPGDFELEENPFAAELLSGKREWPVLVLCCHFFLGDRHDIASATEWLIHVPAARALEEEGRAWLPALLLVLLPLRPKCTCSRGTAKPASRAPAEGRLCKLEAGAVWLFHTAGPPHSGGLLWGMLFIVLSSQLTCPFELELLWPRPVLRSSE